MRIVMFYHSLLSDWNYGNSHFLRGVVVDMLARGHDVIVYEPANSWSRENLMREYGRETIDMLFLAYPTLEGISRIYNSSTLDLDQALDGADLVLVHEWNDHRLVRRIGTHRLRSGNYRLLFHDTHHHSVTDPENVARYDLSGYDGVLAFGEVIRGIYLEKGWAANAWTWHEAADIRLFHPMEGVMKEGDVIWIGNWGDDERTAELQEFLLDPICDLDLSARIHGVRYSPEVQMALEAAGIDYTGWLPNFLVPSAFARYRVTVHVPRRTYVESLPGIPTIRPFEALACGIPLICAPWEDTEGLFTAGEDYLIARDGAEMRRHLRDVLNDADLAGHLAGNGLQTILARHTCGHRVEELFGIYEELQDIREQSGAEV